MLLPAAPSFDSVNVTVDGVKYVSMAWSPGRTTHRASYIFERGIWRATCRSCGWQTSDVVHRQAALLFRAHIRSEALSQEQGDGAAHREEGLAVDANEVIEP